jgi:hypothetical protein
VRALPQATNDPAMLFSGAGAALGHDDLGGDLVVGHASVASIEQRAIERLAKSRGRARKPAFSV